MADQETITGGGVGVRAGQDVKAQYVYITGGGLSASGTIGIEGADGSTQASASNPVPVAEIGVVSSANSSTTPLTGGATFTGTSVSTLNYGSIAISVFADQNSATNGLSIEQSSNGTNWDFVDTYTITANVGRPFVIPVQASFVRVRYTNGATPQTAFRLQLVLKPQMPRAAAIRPAEATTLENDFDEVYAIIGLANGVPGSGGTSDAARSIQGAATTGLGVLANTEAPVTATAAALTQTVTSVAASNVVLKNSAGNLYNINITTGASAGYLMIFNATSAPSDGTVTPIWVLPVAANTGFARDFRPPLRFSTGCTAVFSTTGPFTKTASATAFIGGSCL